MTRVRTTNGWRRLAAALSLIACCAVARGADPPASPPVPEFHRVYVPADQIQKGTWTQGYLPIDSAHFKRLVESISTAARGAPPADGAHLMRTQWSAQLSGDDLLVGIASLDFERVGDSVCLFPLSPWTPAIDRGTWRDRTQRAQLGTGPDGHVGVLVEGESLDVDWSLRGERTASGAVAFHLELPSCPVTRFTADLPKELELLAEPGIASHAAGPSAKLTRWTVELGGNHRTTLKIVSDAAARERRPLTLLRQALTYDFSPRGINLGAQLKLDIHGEPIQRLAVDLDPSLMLVAARYGELQIPWSATIDVETRVSHIVLQLPEPITGTGRVVQLSAIAPLPTGKRFRLPGLQAESVSWQEGTATLLIPDSLVVEQFAFDGCRQSRSTARPAPETGDAIEVQCYRPGAAVEIVLAHPRSEVNVDSGALVEVGNNEITSQLVLALSVPRGQRRELEATVNPRWIVDGVTHAASGRPAEWEVDDSSDPSRLKMRPDEPLTPQSPVRLLVRGHRQLPAASSFEAQQFQMLDLDPWQPHNRLISVRASEGTQLRWSGTVDLKRLDPLELGPAALELFARAPNGLLFAEDPVFAQSVVAIDRRKPSFTADIRIDAVVQRDVLTETYTLSCVPESASVERLLVRLSQARPAALEWKLAGVNSGQFSARRISAGEQAQAGLSAGGEAWEISLRLSRPGPFELRAVRSVAFDGETHLALASVGDAVSQRGTLTVRALGDSGLAIKNRRLSSVPAEFVDPARYQTARAAFHYQPTSDDVGAEPAMSLEPKAPTQAESGAWAWIGELKSRYSSAQSVHWATFRLQTAGRERLKVELPANAALQGVWVDRARVAVAAPGASELSVDLPPGGRLATLTLYFATDEGLPTLTSVREAPFPTLDLPVLARRWHVEMPRGFEVLDSDPRFPTESLSSRSWNERLFGIFSRDAGRRLFNPLSAEAWRGLIQPRAELEQGKMVGEHFLENLGTLMSENLSGEAESQLTWGQLIQLCADEESKVRRPLLVESESLAKLGLNPGTRVRFQSGNSAQDRGAGLLDQLRLALLIHPSFIAIVARDDMAADGRQLTAVESSPMLLVAPGPLLEVLQSAARGERSLRYESAANWRAGGVSEGPPWTNPESRAELAHEPNSWNSYAWHFSGNDAPPIRVVYLAAVGSLAWAVLLGTAALVIWLRPRPTILIGCATISAALALWLPAAWAPLASAIFLAALACLLARMVRIDAPTCSTVPASSRSRSSRVRTSAIESGAMLVILAALLGAASIAAAQGTDDEKSPREPVSPPNSSAAAASGSTSEPDKASSPPAGYQVLVPEDAPGEAAEKTYYVPDAFYKQLHRLAAGASGEPKGWMVTRANYQGAISRDPVSKQLGMTQLKARYDLLVFQSNVQVALPVSRDSMAGMVAALRLEGRPVAPRWNENGTRLLAGPLGPGSYRLDLELQPKIQSDGTTSGIDVAVPPLANATLLLTLPPDLPAIDLPTARGQIRVDKQRSELTAQFGASDRMVVRWPSGAGAQAAAPTIDVDELIWMRVRPGTTILDAKFKFRVLEGRLRQIQLLADPRLRLLPSNNPQSPIAAVRATPGDPQRIDLELGRIVEDQVVIDMSFLLTGSSGVGNLRLPRLESTNTRAAKRWLAVNVDPALEYREQLGEDSKPLTTNEFAAAWGLAELRPQAVYSIPRGEPMWVLATQPTEPQTAVEEVLAVSIARNFTAFELHANLSTVQGYLSQLALQVPSGANIERVSVLDGEAERVARWSLASDGRLTVFLAAPLTGNHPLRIQGRVDTDPQTPSAIPRVALAGVRVKRRELQIYRQSELLVQLDSDPPFTPVDPTPLALVDDFGSLFASYLADESQGEIVVKKSANAPQSKAVLVTSLEHASDSWTAELDYRLDVSGGLVDVLQFEIPPQWSEPYQVEPPLRIKIVPIPGEARRQMFVYPRQPIGGRFQLKIRGRVALSPGDRLRVPEILPQRVQEIQRYVVVPRLLDGQQVAWETVGLSPAGMPRDFARPDRDSDSTAAFQVSGDHYQAAIKAVRRAQTASRVRLADIHIAWNGDNRFRGVAQFDLQSAGADHCVAELPPDCRLLHASLEGLPAQVTEIDAKRWRIALGPNQLPQRLEFVYLGPLSGSSARKRF
jgi:hypothetical protein